MLSSRIKRIKTDGSEVQRFTDDRVRAYVIVMNCVLSQEYSDEREQLQKKILKLCRTLTKQVLNELIDHIDVYETQGTGKNKTQRLVIYYKFVGYLDIDPTQCHPNYTADIREGVAIEYVSCEPPGSLKELFSEGYNADDDSFEGAETEQA